MALKLQQGGSFDPFFTIYQSLRMEPPRRESRSSSRESSSKKEKEKKEEDPILKMVIELFGKIKGLPNEMRDVIAGFTSSLRLAKEFGNGNVEDLTALYLLNLLKLKIAEYNMKSFDDVYKEAQRLGNLSDVALIGNSVVVLDSNGKITTVSMSKWLEVKDSGEYKPLTNGNIMWYRSNVPSYAFDGDLLLVVLENIGTDQVVKMIQERALNLGSVEEIVDQYGVKQGNTITKGLELIQLGIKDGPDGVYKLTTTNENSATLIEAALKYIYSSLNDLARARLNFLAVNSNGTTKDIGDLILNLLSSKASAKSKISFGFDSSASKAAGITNAEGEKTNTKLNTPAKWLMGLGNKENFIINLGGTDFYSVDTNTMPLTNSSDNPIGANSTLLEVTEGPYHSVLDMRNVSMGMKLIDASSFGKVLLTDGKISSVDFPYIEENGVIMPNLSPLVRKNKQKADEEIRRMGISLNDKKSIAQNYLIINLIYEKNNLPPAYTELGELIPEKWREFGVIHGKASNMALRMDQLDSNPLLQEDLDDYSILNYRDIVKEENWDDRAYGGLSSIDHLYKGTIWIPVQTSYSSALYKTLMTPKEAIDLDTKDLALRILQLYQKPPQI